MNQSDEIIGICYTQLIVLVHLVTLSKHPKYDIWNSPDLSLNGKYPSQLPLKFFMQQIRQG